MIILTSPTNFPSLSFPFSLPCSFFALSLFYRHSFSTTTNYSKVKPFLLCNNRLFRRLLIPCAR
ncbi:hypothetical protein ACB092_08G046500 [Castanea dentata]